MAAGAVEMQDKLVYSGWEQADRLSKAGNELKDNGVCLLMECVGALGSLGDPH